jgi:hypothetical protein
MAMPVRRVDAPAPRRRTDSTPRTPTRARGTSASTARPELRIVPRRRAAFNAAVVLAVLIVGLMLAAVVLHTRLTERQLQIDRTEQEVTEARERFDVLRRQRAELRAPSRLALAGRDMGMIVAPTTEFAATDGRTLAEAIAAAGTVDELTEAVDPADPLEQISRVKAATDE